MTAGELSHLSEVVDQRHKIQGLDSLRFLCAFTVAMWHFGLLPVLPPGVAAHGLAKLIYGLQLYVLSGPAAVIIFFLISGFCIHFPFRSNRGLEPGSFWIKRFVRIGIPAAIFCLLWAKTFPLDRLLRHSPFWSNLCELVYYATYPAILSLRRRLNWPSLLIVASCAAVALIVTRIDVVNGGGREYPNLGLLTCVVGLPPWLLGCYLAEHYQRFRSPSTTGMWCLRVGLLASSLCANYAHTQTFAPWASNIVLLDLFALPAWMWLGFEIAYYRVRKPSRLLEWGGTWSYSIYLVHPFVELAAVFGGAFFMSPFWRWTLLPLMLPVAYVFYLLVELPAHRLAIAAGKGTVRKHRESPILPV